MTYASFKRKMDELERRDPEFFKYLMALFAGRRNDALESNDQPIKVMAPRGCDDIEDILEIRQWP